MTASIFMNNKNQAIRLPKSQEFPSSVKKVEIITLNETSKLITEKGKRWDEWFVGVPSNDPFDIERDQPEEQTRESFDA